MSAKIKDFLSHMHIGMRKWKSLLAFFNGDNPVCEKD